MSSPRPKRDESEWPLPDDLVGGPPAGYPSVTFKKPPSSAVYDKTGSSNQKNELDNVEGRGIRPSRPINPQEGLDEFSISQLRQFFELLDRWDREHRNI